MPIHAGERMKNQAVIDDQGGRLRLRRRHRQQRAAALPRVSRRAGRRTACALTEARVLRASISDSTMSARSGRLRATAASAERRPGRGAGRTKGGPARSARARRVGALSRARARRSLEWRAAGRSPSRRARSARRSCGCSSTRGSRALPGPRGGRGHPGQQARSRAVSLRAVELPAGGIRVDSNRRRVCRHRRLAVGARSRPAPQGCARSAITHSYPAAELTEADAIIDHLDRADLATCLSGLDRLIVPPSHDFAARAVART